MKIAVAVTATYARISGHAGRTRRWLVFETGPKGHILASRRVFLDPRQVFHHHPPGTPHPLDGVDAVIAASAGEGFVTKMGKRGIRAALTAEPDPAKAACDLVLDRLTPPRPRPIGSLLCKAIDRLGGGHGHED